MYINLVSTHYYRLARKIAGSNVPTEDFNLDDSYYLLFGIGRDPLAGGLSRHVTGTGNPQVSTATVNPVSGRATFGGNEDSVRSGLIRAHGIFMWIAWALLAPTGIFFASYMRPALPNGEWFQVHRALMVTSLFVGAIGFLFIFVAQINRATPGLITLGGANVGHFFWLLLFCLL